MHVVANLQVPAAPFPAHHPQMRHAMQWDALETTMRCDALKIGRRGLLGVICCGTRKEHALIASA